MNEAMLEGRPSLLHAVAMLPPRLSLGATMIKHGLAKLNKDGQAQSAGFFEQIGIRPARPWVIATGVTELASGISAVLGFATRFTALGVIATQAVAIAKVHRKNGFDVTKGGYEFNLALIAISLATLLRGPGPLSLSGALRRGVQRRERRRLRLFPRQRRGSRLIEALG
ncbi:DoxX family protein [Corallococcus sp. H22C18031201]|nr:DoxX family protein [Corallococcus sp. H22C18031201]